MSTTVSKFATRRFTGAPLRFFRVDKQDLSTAQTTAAPADVHLILNFDRSGSMYGKIEQVKATLLKVLTVGEFNIPTLRVTLNSFSSSGDVQTHFSRVSVTDIMKPGSAQQRAIQAIQATCMTGISQTLVTSERQVNDAELTAIMVHTDGFANDPSPSAEVRNIASAVASLKKHPRVFANTIAHGTWCDYNLMASIANGLSGVCVQAEDVRAVYDSIFNTLKLLSGNLSPAVEVSRGNASFVTFVSRSARKILGSSDSLQVQGLATSDDKTAYRYTELTEAEYNSLQAPVAGENGESVRPILAYSRAQLAQGAIPTAKYAMLAARDPALIAHAKALVNSEIAAFATALETALFNEPAYVPNAEYGLGATGPSVLRVLSALNRYHGAVDVNLPAFLANYKRRGVKRVPGVRLADGTLDLPSYEARSRQSPDGFISVSGFDLNRNTASVNMLVTQPQDIFPRGGSVRVASVGAVSLDPLKSFNNYTIVGDGSLNVPNLPLRIRDKRLWNDLAGLGVVTGDYVPNAAVTIDLTRLPLVDYDQSFLTIDAPAIKQLAQLMVLSKILAGATKGESASLTSEQVAELKTYYLTPALNFSPPTTTEYTDLAQALATGQVDTRLSYKIDLGLPEITSLSKLKSGNEYLQRRFTATVNGAAVAKPTLDLLTQAGVTWGLKKLTAATKLDAVDDLSFPVYAGLLGLEDDATVRGLLKEAGQESPDAFLKVIRSGNKEDVVATATETAKRAEAAIEAVYDQIRPLAFYVGAAGMVPESLNATALTADEFTAKFPNAKLSKDEKEEGTFYLLPNNTVLTVFITGEYFSVTPAAA